MEQSILTTDSGISNWANSITKRGRYCKVWQLYYKVGEVLSSEATIITKKGSFALLKSGARAITKWGRQYTINWGSHYYKVGPSLLQSWAHNTKWGHFITKWGRYYKVVQILQIKTVHISKVHQEVGQKNLLPFPSPLICLLGTRINSGTCFQIEPVRFESRVLQYVEMAFRRDRPF